MGKKRNTTKTVPIPPLQEDQKLAESIRTRLGEELKKVCLILDEATLNKLVVSFQLKPTGDGRTIVQGIFINRVL